MKGTTMSDEGTPTYEARMVILKYKFTPNIDDIEQETDVTAAEKRSDLLSIEYLRLGNQRYEMRQMLAQTEQQLGELEYRFTAARRKFLELKNPAISYAK